MLQLRLEMSLRQSRFLATFLKSSMLFNYNPVS